MDITMSLIVNKAEKLKAGEMVQRKQNKTNKQTNKQERIYIRLIYIFNLEILFIFLSVSKSIRIICVVLWEVI